jgi:hypothetical protein
MNEVDASSQGQWIALPERMPPSPLYKNSHKVKQKEC